MIVDLFAGPGGWDQGLATLGADDVVGIEHDTDACDTAAAAGHLRIQADVATYPTGPFAGRATGLIASPPCQAFSLAGTGAGRNATERLLAHVDACSHGWVAPPADLCGDDVRADLTLQPVRWADALRPDWIACEQVPPVADLWHAIARLLRLWGYDADVKVLNVADFGVPQTRRRAILLASRVSRVRWPEPTHFDPRAGMSLFGLPWQSLDGALGLTEAHRGRFDDVADDVPWTLRTGANTMKHSRDVQDVIAYERAIDQPAPTLDAKVGSAWKIAPVGTHGHAPHRWKAGRQDAQRIDGSVEPLRLTDSQAGVLQSFPADYPWAGTRASRFVQIGNAVPPAFAAALLRPLVAAGGARSVA